MYGTTIQHKQTTHKQQARNNKHTSQKRKQPAVWEPTIWEPTVSGHRFWISLSNHFIGVYSLGEYNLGACSFEPLILDFVKHSLHWSLLSGGQEAGSLQSRDNDFGFRQAPIALGPIVWVPTASDHRCWISSSTLCTEAYSLRAYSLEAYSSVPLVFDLVKHSLHWGLQSGPTAWAPIVAGHRF